MAARPEQEIFDELASLCISPGYAHVIAHFCFRDHVVGYADTLKSVEYAKPHSFKRLNRAEVSTLIGLMVRAPFDLTLPDLKTLNGYTERTEALLAELHEALNEPAKAGLLKAFTDPDESKKFNPFASAETLREPIFYSAESAYSFQYRDLSVEKYSHDAAWLKEHKGFTAEDARKVVIALSEFINKQLFETLKSMRGLPKLEWSILAGFQFTIDAIAVMSGLSEITVTAVINAFTCPADGNTTFTSLNEFNAANAFPILKADGDNHILFLYASLTEAFYETPFFWMNDDKAYKDIASGNRGRFTEEFVTARLEKTFGKDKVFRNVDVWETSARKTKLGEIDTLVLFGDRAVVVQAKSKKLTLAARKGNDLQLQDDFKKAVQDACDQALACSQHLLTGTSFVADSSGEEIKLPTVLEKIHPICVVSDHYPALSFQARQFLSFTPTDHIEKPLVCDVFFIDVVTEFLETPLRFLSYLELRAQAADNITLSHENIALGYHLRRNLWLDEYDFVALVDDLSADIDIAMAARRDGIPGERTPPGILTHLKGTAVGRIIAELEKRAEPGAIKIGLQLLKLDGDSAISLSQVIDKIVIDAINDGKPHNATMSIGKAISGITVHCNALPDAIAIPMLEQHCEQRKYSVQAKTWIGLALSPGDSAVRFGLWFDHPWEQDARMDEEVAGLPPPMSMSAIKKLIRPTKTPKVGRNDPCPCGSGLKYKKCHLLKG